MFSGYETGDHAGRRSHGKMSGNINFTIGGEHMVRRICVFGTVLFLAGCAQVGNECVNHTSFCKSHQMADFFQHAVARENTRIESRVPMVRTVGTAGDKSLSLSFKGDDQMRRRIVQEYKQNALSELQAADLSAQEDSVTQRLGEQMLRDCDIFYSTRDAKTEGLLETSSVLDHRGYVIIEVHLLEYKGR
jgi:hypothetical protein